MAKASNCGCVFGPHFHDSSVTSLGDLSHLFKWKSVWCDYIHQVDPNGTIIITVNAHVSIREPLKAAEGRRARWTGNSKPSKSWFRHSEHPSDEGQSADPRLCVDSYNLAAALAVISTDQRYRYFERIREKLNINIKHDELLLLLQTIKVIIIHGQSRFFRSFKRQQLPPRNTHIDSTINTKVLMWNINASVIGFRDISANGECEVEQL